MASTNPIKLALSLALFAVASCTTIDGGNGVPERSPLSETQRTNTDPNALSDLGTPEARWPEADATLTSDGDSDEGAQDTTAFDVATTSDVADVPTELDPDALPATPDADAIEAPLADTSESDTPSCQPLCDGAVCGPDGCGGTCGDCDPGLLCSQGACIEPGSCNSNCTDKICGPDGCGGICGYCTYPEVCDGEGLCVEVCVPSCDGKFCGPDGCGGTCGTCEAPLLCGDNGICYQPGCVPSCVGKVCGNDGCGGDCGICAEPKICQNGSCQLGPCGTVTSVGTCQGNVVVWCSEGVFLLEDDCDAYEDHACTYDGFANSYACKPVGPCTPKCEDKTCGSDACGGWCGICPEGWSCLAGACAPEQGADCGGEITTLGECIEGELWFCSLDKLYSVNCNELGQSCAWDQSQGKYACL